MAGVGIGKEGDDGEVRRNPIVTKSEGEVDWRVERHRDGLLFVKEADDGRVQKSVAGIFAGRDAGVETFLGYGNPQIEW